jgi:hypothetical protein
MEFASPSFVEVADDAWPTMRSVRRSLERSFSYWLGSSGKAGATSCLSSAQHRTLAVDFRMLAIATA